MDNVIALLVELFVGALIFWLCLWGIKEICGAIVGATSPPTAQAVRLAAIVRVFLVLLLIAVTISFLLGVAGYWGSWGWGHHWRGGHL
jgi:hypothetical protein